MLSRGSLNPASLEQEGVGQGTCWEMMQLLMSITPLGSRRRWKGWEEYGSGESHRSAFKPQVFP